MSNVTDVLNDIDNNVAYYNPSDDTSGKKYATIEEGTYEATVSKLTIKKDIVVKNQYLSDIFEATYKLDDKEMSNLRVTLDLKLQIKQNILSLKIIKVITKDI